RPRPRPVRAGPARRAPPRGRVPRAHRHRPGDPVTPHRPTFGARLRSEALKAATMPATYGLLAAILAMTALNTALPLSDLHANLAVVQTVHHALSGGRDFTVLFVALGAVGAATEFRHGTAIPSLLATPRRSRLLGAKIATYLALGLLAALTA